MIDYLVIDQISFGILAWCPSPTVANALSKGILNSSPMAVTHHIESAIDTDSWQTVRNNSVSPAYILEMQKGNSAMSIGEASVAKYIPPDKSGKLFNLCEFTNPGEAFLKSRSIAIKRSIALSKIENICLRYSINTQIIFNDRDLYIHLNDHLQSGQYSTLIKDWADINSISYEQAFNLLKLYYTSHSVFQIKIHAMCHKYFSLISQLDSIEEIDKLSNYQFESELRGII